MLGSCVWSTSHSLGCAPMLPYPMRVAECAELPSKVKALTLDGQLDAQPGQFVMLWLFIDVRKPEHYELAWLGL